MSVPGGGASFWAERMRDAHPEPYRYRGKIVIPPPDDRVTAALDECTSALDELYELAGDDADTLADAIDETGDHLPTVVSGILDHYHLTRPPEHGWHDLVERINVYGAGIEYDLDAGTYRYGLHDYFTGAVPGGWDHLLRMLSRMPMGSHYRAAVADDDELAERMAEIHGPLHKRKGSNRPPLTEFDRQVMYLHTISNQLTYLAWAVFAAQAGKKKGTPPKGNKGPETADERVDFRGFLVEHEEIVGQVLKSKGGSGRSGPAPEAVRGAVLLPRAIGQDDPAENNDT